MQSPCESRTIMQEPGEPIGTDEAHDLHIECSQRRENGTIVDGVDLLEALDRERIGVADWT